MSPEYNIYHFGEYTFDEKELLLRRNEEIITLEPNSARVLSVLLANNCRVVRKSEILEKVWDKTTVDDNGVEQCIRKIRTALELKVSLETAKSNERADENQKDPTSEQPFDLRTIPRRGMYRFVGKVKSVPKDVQPVFVKNEVAGKTSTINPEAANETPSRNGWFNKKKLILISAVFAGLLVIAVLIGVFFTSNGEKSIAEISATTADCKYSSAPVFNPFEFTYADRGSLCTNYQLIDVALDVPDPQFSKSMEEYYSIREYKEGDKLVVLIYILNGANPELDPSLTAAKNVRIINSITESGNLHKISVTLTADNAPRATGSVSIRTPDGMVLESFLQSGYFFNLEGRAIANLQEIELNNSTVGLGYLDAGMPYSLFLSYKLKVSKKGSAH